MPNHMNDDELNQVTGGLVSYANASGEDKSPNGTKAYPIIQAKCVDCGATFLGPSNQVDRDVIKHINLTGHSYCHYTNFIEPW